MSFPLAFRLLNLHFLSACVLPAEFSCLYVELLNLHSFPPVFRLLNLHFLFARFRPLKLYLLLARFRLPSCYADSQIPVRSKQVPGIIRDWLELERFHVMQFTLQRSR